MADIVFYGNITVSALGFEGVNLVTKGFSDENLCSISNVASQWSGTITSKATTTSFGLVKIGSGFSASNGTISVGSATGSGIGGVIVGNGLSVSSGTVKYSVCRKRVYTLSNGSLTIDGTYGAYYYSLGSNTTFTFNSSALSNSIYAGNVCEFDLAVAVGSTAYTATFPNNITWDHAPSAFNTNTTYLFRFRTYDRGSHWFGYCLNSVPTITGIDVFMEDGYVGEVLLFVNGTQTGDTVVWTVDGVDYNNAPDLSAGTHTVTVTVSRAGYQDYTQSGTVTVSKNQMYGGSTADDSTPGEVTIELYCPSDYEGICTVVIGNRTETVDCSQNHSVTFYNLPAGDYTYTATFAEDSRYVGDVSTGSVTVSAPVCYIASSLISSSVSLGEDAVVEFSNIPDDMDGTAICTVLNANGETVSTRSTPLIPPDTMLPIPPLSIGVYTIVVTYSLNNYEDGTGETELSLTVTGRSISVSKVTYDVTGTIDIGRSGDTSDSVLIYFSESVTDFTVTFQCNGKPYNCALVRPGVYRVTTLSGRLALSVGAYSTVVQYSGSSTYASGTDNTKQLYVPSFKLLTINNPVEGEDIVITGQCGAYSGTRVTCTDTDTNTSYIASINNGVFTVQIPTTTARTYNFLFALSYTNNNANLGYATFHCTAPPVVVSSPVLNENILRMTIEVEDDDQVSFGTTTEDDVLYPVTVDWGDGDSDTVTDDYLFSHTYEDAGTYELIIRSQDGRLPVMSFGDLGSRLLSVDFADVEWYEDDGEGGEESTVDCSEMFNGCSSLESIPSTLFARNTNIYQFERCFYGTALESIPSGLFNGVSSGNFTSCFANCDSLETIPVDLFSTVEYGHFEGCFSNDEAIVPADTKPFVPPVWEKDIDSNDIDNGDRTGSYDTTSSDASVYIPDIYGGDIPYRNNVSNPQFNDKCWDWDSIEVEEDGDTGEYDVVFIYTCVDPSNDEWCRGWIDFSQYDTLVTTLSDATTHEGTSLRDALENADDGDVIGFAVNGTIVLEQGSLTLPTAVTVDGDNRITIDGDNSYGIFKVVSGESVSGCTLKNLTMVNGNDDNDWFGAIGLSGLDLTVGGCVIKECSYDSIYVWDEGDLTVRNSSISNGTGGIYVYGADVEMTDCSITRCRDYGIYVEEGNETAHLRMSGCSVSNNGYYLEDEGTEDEYVAISDYDNGVGICSYYGTLDISDSVFSSNYCEAGAVIYLQGGSMTLANSTFCPGSVEYSDLEDSYSADKIRIKNTNATIDRCVFRDNKKMSRGGYAQIDNDTSNDDYKVTFNRCLFTGNVTDRQDFSFVHISESSSVAFANTVFTGNTLCDEEGCYCSCIGIEGEDSSHYPNVTILNCTFTNNENGSMYNIRLVDDDGAGAYGSLDISNTVSVGCSEEPMDGNGTVNYNYFLDDHDYGDIDYNSNLPLFAEDGYTPVANSQVIDEGDNSYYDDEEYGDEDYNGEDRIYNTTIDLGAVEYLPPVIENLLYINNAPVSNPMIYEENATYPVDELIEVEGVEEGDTVDYEVESMLYGGNDVPVIDLPGTYNITTTVSRLGFRKSIKTNTVAIKRNDGVIRLIEDTIYVGDVGVVTASVPVDANGYLTCEINGKTYTGTISNGRGELALENIPVGTHTVSIVAHCTNYTDIVLNTTITAEKRTYELLLTCTDVDVGDNIELTGIVPEDLEGTATCTFDGSTYTTVISEGGYFVLNIPTTREGVFTINVTVSGSEKYTDASSSATISVTDDRDNSILTLSASDVYTGQNLIVTGMVSYGGSGGFVIPTENTTPCSYNGTATCVFEGGTYTATVTDGEFTLSVPTTTAGSVTLNVGVSGSLNYKDATNSVSVTVLAKVTPTLQLNASDVAVGSNIIINGTVPSDYDGTASCTFEGTTHTASASNGSFQLSIPTTEGGTMILTVSLAPTAKYTGASNTATVVVSSVIPLTLTFTNSDSMPWNNLILGGSVSATDLVNGVASCTYGNNSYTGNVDANGAFSINLSSANVTVGEQTFTIVVTSDNYNTVSDDVEVTVEKAPIYLYTSATSPKVGTDVVITTRGYQDAEMRLRASNSGRIIAAIEGVGYYTDFINGAAKHFVDSETLGVGTHNYIVNYGGDDRYLSASGSGSFTVKPSSGGTPIS